MRRQELQERLQSLPSHQVQSEGSDHSWRCCCGTAQVHGVQMEGEHSSQRNAEQ